MRRVAAIGGLVLALVWGCGGSDGDAPPPGPAVTYNLQVISDDPMQDTNAFLNEGATLISFGTEGPVDFAAFKYFAYFPTQRPGELRRLLLYVPPEASFEPSRVFPARTSDPRVQATIDFFLAPYDPPVDALASWGTFQNGDGEIRCLSRENRVCTYEIELLLTPSGFGGATSETTLRGTFTVDYSRIGAGDG